MIGLDRIVRILPLILYARRRAYQLIEHSRVRRHPVGFSPRSVAAVLKRPGQEPARGSQIPLLPDQDVDDLAELVDTPVQRSVRSTGRQAALQTAGSNDPFGERLQFKEERECCGR